MAKNDAEKQEKKVKSTNDKLFTGFLGIAGTVASAFTLLFLNVGRITNSLLNGGSFDNYGVSIVIVMVVTLVGVLSGRRPRKWVAFMWVEITIVGLAGVAIGWGMPDYPAVIELFGEITIVAVMFFVMSLSATGWDAAKDSLEEEKQETV